MKTQSNFISRTVLKNLIKQLRKVNLERDLSGTVTIYSTKEAARKRMKIRREVTKRLKEILGEELFEIINNMTKETNENRDD